MNQDDIIRMAREARLPFEYDSGRIMHLKELERFADLVIKRRDSTDQEQKRQWVGLTKEELNSLIPCVYIIYDAEEYRHFARAIEAKLREKNA